MHRQGGSYVCCRRMRNVLLLVLVQMSCQLNASSGSIVQYLPGFDGPLPFHLETGYVGIGKSDDVQVFYYFMQSERNPEKDPLTLWISGAPCCSSLSGLIYEIGPLAFKVEEYKGGVPNLELRPQSWTKESSIIFVDLPANTGFSYSKTSNPPRSDYGLVHQAHQFLRKWLVQHPEYLSNQVYVAGDSYSGLTIPAIIQEIANGNEKGVQPHINVEGYLLGNPLTTRKELNHVIPFAHGMGLISDEMYMSLQKNCKGEYVDKSNKSASCARDVISFYKLMLSINRFHILEPLCEKISPEANEVSRRRSLISEKFNELLDSDDLSLPPLSCRDYVYYLSSYWANNDGVREALHVRKGSTGKWQRCNTEKYIEDIPESFEYHANLSEKGFRSLIYSGDHDSITPFLATQAWIRALNYSIVDDWRPWLVKGQVAGYTRTYSNQMTFATVKGAGHLAPEYKLEECFAMFSRWISKKDL